MRNRIALWPALLLFGLSANTAADTALISLTDGTELRGEVVSLKGGHYRIATDSMGELVVPQDEVRMVRYPKGATDAVADPAAAGIDGLRSQIEGNPALMRRVHAMAADPAMQALLSDPALNAALRSGDYASLMSNPDALKLLQQIMQNNEFEAIARELKPAP